MLGKHNLQFIFKSTKEVTKSPYPGNYKFWQFSSEYISKSLRLIPESSPRDNIHNVQQRDSGLQRAP